MNKVAFVNADQGEIHGGEWHATNRAYGNSEHDAAITVMSDDGIVATVATIHCGQVRAEEIAVMIAALPALRAACELIDRAEKRGEYADRSGDTAAMHESSDMMRKAVVAVRAALARAEG